MDTKLYNDYKQVESNPPPRTPSRPFPPQAGATPEQYRKYADELDKYNADAIVFAAKRDEWVAQRDKAREAVMDSIIEEYSRSPFKRETISYILNHAVHATDNLSEADDMMMELVQLVRDVTAIEKGEPVY